MKLKIISRVFMYSSALLMFVNKFINIPKDKVAIDLYQKPYIIYTTIQLIAIMSGIVLMTFEDAQIAGGIVATLALVSLVDDNTIIPSVSMTHITVMIVTIDVLIAIDIFKKSKIKYAGLLIGWINALAAGTAFMNDKPLEAVCILCMAMGLLVIFYEKMEQSR